MKVCWYPFGSRAQGAVNNRYGFDEIAGRDGLINFDEWARYVAKEETFPENQLTQCGGGGPTKPPPPPYPYTKKPYTPPFQGPATWLPPAGIGIP